ncbi:MAG: hypothetical protein DRH26_14625, partial [Deltaproteobacteria bacterium]
DRKKNPDGQKKPFFRKMEIEDEPLDIPPDLVELEPGSSEAKKAHRKYYESWIQSGDHVFVLGTALTDGSSSSMKIVKAKKSSPLFLSMDARDLTGKAFQNNFMVLSLVGLGLGLLGIVLALIGLGVVD